MATTQQVVQFLNSHDVCEGDTVRAVFGDCLAVARTYTLTDGTTREEVDLIESTFEAARYWLGY